MIESFKEQLSQHVENIFKSYIASGLHICDIATGGGKSYTIGKLTCEYYPKYFDRIVILCVQNKLVDSMNREILKFVSSDNSKIKLSDILILENNPDVIKKAIKNNSFHSLLEEMNNEVGKLDKNDKKASDLKRSYHTVKKIYEGLKGLITTYDNTKNEYIQGQINEGEANLRRNVRIFFDIFKNIFEKKTNGRKISLEKIIKTFPSLTEVYPQVNYRTKKVLLMTVHKAMYGIDPILAEKISLTDLAEKKKRTLFIFDESDQAAIAMRNSIIDQAIESAGGIKRFAKGYNGYLQYKNLIDNPNHLANDYFGTLMDQCLKNAQNITNKNWEKTFGKTLPFKNIFLDGEEDLETYRRGVFFSGPVLKLNIANHNNKNNNNNSSFVCYQKGNRHFTLVHADNEEELKSRFDYVIPMGKFLSLIQSNITTIKSQFRKVISESLKDRREKFEKETTNESQNTHASVHYLGYPTLDREIHTLFSRFETTSEYQFEQQINEFMTNRKNLLVQKDDETLKLPDPSVYSQGVQLYQEELDELDNSHRVRLSCREISTTPEKMLIDIVNNENTSTVLCSATSSSWSVVSNFDIQYLKQILGNRVHLLSIEYRNKFDELVEKTYPQDHIVQIVPIEHYEYESKLENAIALPDKYRQMFSKEALDDGLVDEWFMCTRHELRTISKERNDMFFQLYRLFQFIEAYHWFISHDDIHSMIYFQNRTGDKDRKQISIISSLIDGSYKNMKSQLSGELPDDWENCHIRISKDWEEVESKILSDLSGNKDAKIMLVSAYGSFKAGANMQYNIPVGLDYVAGDNWENEGETMKKDWDAVFLQSPTSYLMMNEDGNDMGYEKSLYNAMLTLMMLMERGCLNRVEVAQWLYRALINTNAFKFGEKNNPGVMKDKSAWAQTMVEQAVGRLCRTRNKPHITYILFDETMVPYFNISNMEKSMTKEFRTLADYILNLPVDKVENADNPEEIIRCNDANYAQKLLDNMRKVALRFTPHSGDDDDFEDEEDDEKGVPYIVEAYQKMNQNYKHTIIKKPVISSLDELDDDDRMTPFIGKCYGKWERNQKDEYRFTCDTDHHNMICPNQRGLKEFSISSSKVRLDTLMKNQIIHEYFKKKGYATEWKPGELILHPQILANDYCGEIGEEAFKAIVLHYTDCKEEDIKHLEGKKYEYADFVILNPDGSYKIAYDVKNMRSKNYYEDKEGDMPTTEKRRRKIEKLGCKLITVNMIKLPNESMDPNEIAGIIDEKGDIIFSAIETLKQQINESKDR